jgi:hypothetical protein
VNTFEPSSQAAFAETLASERLFRTLTEPQSDRIFGAWAASDSRMSKLRKSSRAASRFHTPARSRKTPYVLV